ncbi:hypothetical protein GRI43_07355 [Altererythrobacter luteolus]|uniref:Uncharacterized protein n=1 Tax=Pontixanthobacter luteolus TaxID=295089 RepID=A0A6I4V0G8_9SPHN|nr:hypothetical protein [Pontixanthobacter luteolus]MXP47205.1 hypothetical protein [Pontixanthobacter luteolus]
MMRGSRLRQIGWAVVLSVCITGFVALTFRVNAVKSEVRLAERQLIALERETLLLETEFQTRANQQQLADWNRIEFGLSAPNADQYLENERQLASLGVPRGATAPEPIRVARAPVEGEESSFALMVSPLTGETLQPERSDGGNTGERRRSPMSAPSSLAERLSLDNPLERSIAELPE